jgi:hypothetical protein
MSAEVAVQAALHARLSADPALVGLIDGRVYDFAPQAPDGGDAGAFPYVEVGRVVLAEMDTKDALGFDFVARLHTRSRSGSARQSKMIQGAIYDALHLHGLSVAGWSTILLRRENSETTRAQDGSFHGVCEYRGLIEQA